MLPIPLLMLNPDAKPGHLFHSHRQINPLLILDPIVCSGRFDHRPTTRLKNKQRELH